MKSLYFALLVCINTSFLIGSTEEISLTTGAEWTETVNPDSTTKVTFNFGGVQVTSPRPTTNWVTNISLLRPQLAIWRCGPLSSPSTVHLELLARQTRAFGEGLVVNPENVSAIDQKYRFSNEWLALDNTQPLILSPHTSYQKASSDLKGYREEIHILNVQGVGFRLRMSLSDQLKPDDEVAIRSSIKKLVIHIGSKAQNVKQDEKQNTVVIQQGIGKTSSK